MVHPDVVLHQQLCLGKSHALRTTLSMDHGASKDSRSSPPISKRLFANGWDAPGEGEEEPFHFSPRQLSDSAQVGMTAVI